MQNTLYHVVGREALKAAASFGAVAEDAPPMEKSGGPHPKSNPGSGVMTWNKPSC